jgi:hypothetical protein
MVAVSATPAPVPVEAAPSGPPPCDLAFGDRVWTREGEAGRVAGFYRGATPTVLVRLDSGREHRYAGSELIAA